MSETENNEVKNVSWATVLVITGLVFFVIGLVMRSPAVWVVAVAMLSAGAVTQLITMRGRAHPGGRDPGAW